MNRGVALLQTLLIINPDASPELLTQAIAVAWCIEILQACFLIADDVMDQSSMRRGKPCWYKVCGLAAVNDSLILESIVYRLLKKYSSSETYYLRLLELFHEITFKTEIGQLLDLDTMVDDRAVLEKRFTKSYYQAVVRNKTAYYSFFLPFQAALLIGNSTFELGVAGAFMLSLGYLFQIQDDYLDFYGDPEVIGKVGTDIEEGKCTWLALQFLANASDSDKDVLFQSIGKDDKKDVIGDLYQKYELDKIYSAYQRACFDQYRVECNPISDVRVREACLAIAKLVESRQK